MADQNTSHETPYDFTTSAKAEPIGTAGVAGVRLPTSAVPSQLNDGTDYDAEDARQRADEVALAEAEACDHRHTRIRLIEECECGMVIQETTVGRP